MKIIGGFLMLLAYCSLERGFSFASIGVLLLGLALFGLTIWVGLDDMCILKNGSPNRIGLKVSL